LTLRHVNRNSFIIIIIIINRAQCRLTALIELNALTTTLRRHPV